MSATGYSYWGRYLFPVPIALQRWGQTHGGSVEVRSEQLSIRNTPDLHSVERDSIVPNMEEHVDRGPSVHQSSGTAPGRTFGDGQDGGDTDDVVRSRKSRGKSSCSVYNMVCIDHCQLRREDGSTGLLAVPHLRSNLRRGQPKYLLPSKPSWNPYLASMPNIRFGLTFRSRTLSNNYIPRIPLPLRTRSKYFCYASPPSRSFSTSPQVIRK